MQIKGADVFENERELSAALSWMQQSSYFERRMLLRAQNRKYPRFLYKYMALEDGVNSVAYMRHLLVDNKLWLSSVSDFNDPFDMTAYVTVKASAAERKARFWAMVKKHQPGGRAEQRRALAHWMAKSSDELLRLARKNYVMLMETSGVSCFTERPRDLLMWSHYGGRHMGVCLQFEVARDVVTLTRAMPADYRTDYPVFNWFSSGEAGQVAHALRIKSPDWAYEREWRITQPGTARTSLAFHPGALTGVILGCRADSAERTLAELLKERETAGHPPMRLYKLKRHPKKFRLVAKRERQRT